jgi:hypothetical protein
MAGVGVSPPPPPHTTAVLTTECVTRHLSFFALLRTTND